MKVTAAPPMSVVSFLRLLCHHAEAGSGTLRAYRPLVYLLRPTSLQHLGCRNTVCQSSISHRRITSSFSRGNSRRLRAPPAAATSGAPFLVASPDEQLEWDEAEDSSEPQEVLVLPPPSHSRVKTADFVKSSTAVAQCPPSKHPEFAVIGRSNVGKSSLINMLTGKKALAQISKTPGQLLCRCRYRYVQARVYSKRLHVSVQAKQGA